MNSLGQKAIPVADIIGWDVANWSGCLTYWQPWLGQPGVGTRVLVLGERNGGISLWFALQGFEVLCTDYRLPGDGARELHERWQVTGRMTYAEVDVFKIPWPDDHFDIVACKSVIGGLKLEYRNASTRSLENQKLAVEEIRRVLKPGGVFLGAENLTGTVVHRALRRIRRGRRPGWRHLRVREINWLFSGYTRCEQSQWGFLGTNWPALPALNCACAIADKVLSRIVPPTWLYISFVRARK
jgi:SAM-dependent methyltransferase